MKLTPTEQQAINKYIAAETEAMKAHDYMESLFRARYMPMLETGNIEEAQEYIKQMPDSVAKAYARDAIRVHRGDFDK